MSYSYDNTDQLTGADFDYQSDESYTYDANGNRTNTGYSTGTNNQLLSDGSYDYTYDDEGNRTKKTHKTSGDYVEYEWDHRNQLTAVAFYTSTATLTKRVEYDYDALGRRLRKRVDDNGDGTFDRAERFVYDSSGKTDPATGMPLDDIALVFDETGALKNRYLHGPAIDQVFADEDALNEILWALSDNQGTVRDWADYNAGTDSTSIANHLTFDAFGSITGQTNSGHTPLFAFTGREWDADAKLAYHRGRWYDPVVGRWISEDPIGFGGGDANLARYVGNDPANHSDPSGLVHPDMKINIGFVKDPETLAGFLGNRYHEHEIRCLNKGRYIPSPLFPILELPFIEFKAAFGVKNYKAEAGSNVDWGALMEWLADRDDDIYDYVVLSGHGGPGYIGSGAIRLEDLQDPKSAQYKFIKELGEKLREDGEIILRSCSVADGKRGPTFLKLMSKISGAKVIGYTGPYVVVPHGEEWAAWPNGDFKKTDEYPDSAIK